MEKESVGSVNALHQTAVEHNVTKPCTLFLTPTRIIAVSLEGVNSWAVVTVITALASSLIGLLLRNFLLFLGGFGVGIMSGLLIVVADFWIRHKHLNDIKRANPEYVLEMDKENFQIRYAEILEVEVKIVEAYPKGSFFLPSFKEQQYVVDFVTRDEKREKFYFDRSNLERCLNILRQFGIETIRIEEN